MLTFNDLRKANKLRCETSYHPVEDWTETDWSTAMAGECGELCNLIKKRRRGEDISLEDVADEMGDIVAYLDLLAERMGIDLGSAVVGKFNKISYRIGSMVVLNNSIPD